MARLQLGLSPCPNDTYIFHALLRGLVRPDYPEDLEIEPVFADVQELNRLAMAGRLPFTKISAGAIPQILDKYLILPSGAALGFGCGPLLVARDGNFDPATATIAIPGQQTTARMLLDLHGGFAGPRREMLFSEIIPAVASGNADLGVIIHEGRFTYSQHGLIRILDFGEWWEREFQLPLPLGAIAVRRDVAPELASAIARAITASIHYARKNPVAATGFIKNHAQELEDEVIAAHIRTFVTDYSLDLGPAGREALEKLVSAGGQHAASRDIFSGAGL